MMNLTRKINKTELKDSERFEFLEGIAKGLILRMDEVHPSADNDAHYLFMIWVKPQDHQRVENVIRRNIKVSDPDDPSDWTTRILPNTGDGLIIVSTWL